jgi:GNAT superfamily N-acetyltransferase
MGLEYSADVALLRHAYVAPALQRRGIASALNDHLVDEVQGVGRIVVGTYAANYKARASLEKSGFQQSADSDAVLREYYDIPLDRLESSVAYEKPAQR